MADKKTDILKKIGKIAGQENLNVYAVGGYVRDFFLKRETDEIASEIVTVQESG